jgi:tRNA pseudouridine13 synthase
MISLKIKVTPEDFIVKELMDLELKDDGAYRIYQLEKRHWNTMDALLAIARQNKMPMAKIGYGGRKDRHAVTYQYISVPRQYDLSFNMSNINLTFEGFADDYMSSTVLKGNYFELTIRKIPMEQKSSIEKRIGEIDRYGFPNYFDDQRFGSVINKEEFLAERIIKKHYKGALKLYFTTIYSGDRREEKQRKRAIKEQWGNWQAIAPLCRTAAERDIAKILSEGESKNQLVKALNAIPKEQLSMHFSAYQSFLWNQTLENIILQHINNPFKVKGNIIDYCFYQTLEENTFKKLKELLIPTVSYKIPGNPEVTRVVGEVLSKRDIKPSDFNLTKIRKSFFKSFFRPAIMFPIGLSHKCDNNPVPLTPFEEDDIYRGYLKLKLKFTLPPGSFATMLVKSLNI